MPAFHPSESPAPQDTPVFPAYSPLPPLSALHFHYSNPKNSDFPADDNLPIMLGLVQGRIKALKKALCSQIESPYTIHWNNLKTKQSLVISDLRLTLTIMVMLLFTKMFLVHTLH